MNEQKNHKLNNLENYLVLNRRNHANHIKEKIIYVLKEHPEGLHILGLTPFVGAHRHTVTKYIHELMGAGVIYQREIGTVKLCYLSPKFGKSRETSIKYLEGLKK